MQMLPASIPHCCYTIYIMLSCAEKSVFPALFSENKRIFAATFYASRRTKSPSLILTLWKWEKENRT